MAAAARGRHRRAPAGRGLGLAGRALLARVAVAVRHLDGAAFRAVRGRTDLVRAARLGIRVHPGDRHLVADARMAKDDRKPATRAKILDAAVAQFGHRGFDGATVKDIADLAAVATGSVHVHFGTKSALYAEAVTVAGERFMAAIHRNDTPREPFESLAQRWIAHSGNESEAPLLLPRARGRRPAPGDGRGGEVDQRRFRGLLVRLASATGGRGAPRADTPLRVLATLIVAALTGLVATKHDHGDMVVAVVDNLARLIGDSRERGADGFVPS